ncbi:MAG: VanZ family protein [Bacteroidetes bacterium]|nr:VanZ family protein [Bacteroidota bacterium]
MNNNTPAKNNLTIKKFIPGIAWFFVVMVLLFTPGNDLPEVGDWFTRIDFDKFIHMGVFALLAFLFMFPIGKSELNNKAKAQYFIKITLCACLWGITSEFIQEYFIPGRTYDILDWSADSIGAIIAMLVCRKLYLKS